MKPYASFELTRLQLFIGWLMPRRLVRAAVVRATLHATEGRWSLSDEMSVSAVTVLHRWEKTNAR